MFCLCVPHGPITPLPNLRHAGHLEPITYPPPKVSVYLPFKNMKKHFKISRSKKEEGEQFSKREFRNLITTWAQHTRHLLLTSWRVIDEECEDWALTFSKKMLVNLS